MNEFCNRVIISSSHFVDIIIFEGKNIHYCAIVSFEILRVHSGSEPLLNGKLSESTLLSRENRPKENGSNIGLAHLSLVSMRSQKSFGVVLNGTARKFSPRPVENRPNESVLC